MTSKWRWVRRKRVFALSGPRQMEKDVRDIRATLIVVMLFAAITAGSSCHIRDTIESAAEWIEEPDEAEADRTMAGGTWL